MSKTSAITVRGVSEEIKTALKERAKRNHRSMEKEVLSILADAAETAADKDRELRKRRDEAMEYLRNAPRWKAPDDWKFNREELYDEIEKERGLR